MEDFSADFISKYGKPEKADNNCEYISGGIVGMVHEFTKSVVINFSEEL